jgi:AbiV family abortive infection protein
MEPIHKNTFLTITLAECEKVYLELQKNAERHLQSAQVLANANDNANAVAHIVLGTEELIKAFALFLESKGFGLRQIDGYKKLFTNHRARHAVIKEFYSVIIFFKQFITDEEKPKVNKHWVLEGLDFLGKAAQGALAATKNYEWWGKADTLKQNCFYVDYSHSIISPETIDKAAFDIANKYANNLKEDIRFITLAISKAPTEKLKEFIKIFEEADMKNLIGETIQRSNK